MYKRIERSGVIWVNYISIYSIQLGQPAQRYMPIRSERR